MNFYTATMYNDNNIDIHVCSIILYTLGIHITLYYNVQ